MPSQYEIVLTEPGGTMLASLDYTLGFEYVRVANEVGAFQVALPASFDRAMLRRDYQVQFWRAPEHQQMRLDFLGFIRGWRGFTGTSGQTGIIAYGVDLNDLLRRRVVAYAAGSAQASMSDHADDMMKAVVTDALGSDADDVIAGRDITALGFSVQGNTAEAPYIVKAFSWRNVLDVLQDIAEDSWGQGTRLFFGIVPLSPTSWQFQTWVNQRRNHSWPDGDAPVIFGLEHGNLEDPDLEYDYTEEATYVFGLGQGEGADRIVMPVTDIDRRLASIWNWCEAVQDARQCSTTAGVEDSATQRLAEGRPVVRFTGHLMDTEGTRYGRDWDFCDRVTITYLGQQMDGVVRLVRVGMSDDGAETVHGQAEVVT